MEGEAPLRIELLGRRALAQVEGEQPLSSVTNYYRGGLSSGWHSAIPHYERVRFHSIYAGIDLMWCSRGVDLEYEFEAAAGTDPGQIRLRFRGASRISMDKQGNLELETRAGKIQHRRPVAWQEIAGRRTNIQIALRLKGLTAGFELGPYDRHLPLWIDPVLSYSTYIGGAGCDAGYAMATDGNGGVYMTGTTGSIGFPSLGPGVNGNKEAFVMKFDRSGDLLYNTILMGGGDASGQAIAADASGNVYIAGTTQAGKFPVTKGAWQTVFGGIADAFAAKLNAAGVLVYATYIGGAGQETGTGIAIDSSGNAYVSGFTASVFPTTPGAAQTLYGGGSADAFVVKLNTLGSAAVYSTLLGGSGNDQAAAIAIDAGGHACIAGYTDSPNLAPHAALQPTYGGEGDGLIACLSADGTAWTMVSYLGGSNQDQAFALDIDTSGNLYVGGTTYSSDFPTTDGVLQPAKAGNYDAFVAKLSPGGSTLLYATYLGGNGSDAITSLAVGSTGDVWMGGYTSSTNFPLSGAWQSVAGGSFDAFIAHLSANATVLLTSSYLGGSGDDRVLGITLDPTGLVYATGDTLSNNFPTTAGAMQQAAPGGENAFLAKIVPSAYSISGQVTTQDRGPLSGVAIAMSGAAGATTATDSNGNFLLNNLVEGDTYTVMPSLGGYSFSPSSQTFSNLNANQNASFTALAVYSISGNIALTGGGALSGVIVMLGGNSSCWAVTDASGNYSFNELASGTYTATPSLKGNSFTPVNQTFNNVKSNQTGNFTAGVATLPGNIEVVWQDPVSGFSQVWFLGGAQGTSFQGAATITTNNIWRIAAVADFNGDGFPDIVWQDPVSGASQIWFLGGATGTTLLQASSISGPNSWHIVGATDFNGDGRPDLIWQDPVSGWTQIWFMGGPEGTTVQSAANLTIYNSWRIVGSGDLNGDGHPDMLWQDPVSGTVQIWYLTGALGNLLQSAVNLTASTSHVVAIANFNRDGVADLIWQDPVSGSTQIELLGGAQGTTQIGTVSLSGPNSWRIVGAR
jgi:hypothetical protein